MLPHHRLPIEHLIKNFFIMAFSLGKTAQRYDFFCKTPNFVAILTTFFYILLHFVLFFTHLCTKKADFLIKSAPLLSHIAVGIWLNGKKVLTLHPKN